MSLDKKVNTKAKASLYCLIIVLIQIACCLTLVTKEHLHKQQYSVWFILNLSISVLMLNLEKEQSSGLLNLQKDSTDKRAVSIGFYFSLLNFGVWLIISEFLFFEITLSKIYGIAVMLFFIGFVGLVSGGRWPFSGEEDLLYAKKHALPVIVGNLLIAASVIFGLLLLLFAPFNWRGYNPFY